MGGVASAVVDAVTSAVDAIVAAFTGGHVQPNPVMEELQRRAEEQEARAREAIAKQSQAEEAHRAAEEELRRAEEQIRATEDAARQQEEERRRAEDARRVAEAEVQRADSDRRAAEEQKKQAEEDAKRAEEERAKADAEAKCAREARERAQREAELANQAAAEAHAAREEAQRKLREGIQPIIIPTVAEFNATKRRLRYKEGIFHFAVAGIAGSGKSSLVNALRGLRANDKDAAKVGVTETTSVITRYRDPRKGMPFAWYDVPGSGTLSISDWQYFTDQGLYIFDAIIVLFDNRFTATDVAILRNCARFQIPAYIVRSKARQHIENMVSDMGGDDLEDSERAVLKAEAREQYITKTRASVAENLQKADLPEQRVYLVDSATLARIVKASTQQPKRGDMLIKNGIDELELLRDLFAEAQRRRVYEDNTRTTASRSAVQEEEELTEDEPDFERIADPGELHV